MPGSATRRTASHTSSTRPEWSPAPQALCADSGCGPIEAAWVAAACWLHDTVEDTPITIGWLTDMGFPDIVIHIVSLVRHGSSTGRVR